MPKADGITVLQEIRKKLTIIDADAEVLEMDIGENEWLQDIKSQTNRLAQLTNSMILLSRMEEQPQVEKIEFPISDLAEEALETFQAFAKTHNKTISGQIEPMLSMTGDEKAIRQLITILLDNAVKYSADGGKIELSLKKQKNAIHLSVFNTVESISREELTHLFFARIMKEHSLFLQAGFVGKDRGWIRKAEFFRCEFENLLRQTVRISDGMISRCVLCSEELFTPFTIPAEQGTSRLSGIPIDSGITEAEGRLQCGCSRRNNREMMQQVRQLIERAIRLLDGLIEFKENLLQEVRACRLFTANYPLLIEHILREAKLYRATLEEIRQGKAACIRNLRNTENFWNQIMMEHAMFIRGLLDPSEEELICTADKFAMDFQKLLEHAKRQECRAADWITEKSLEETKEIKEFKTAGAKGILECKIESIILPLLADHVLREANHYIRILECGYKCQEG